MLNNDVLISVIITTYKRNVCILKRAIDSVLNQTYNNVEVIIVDDNKNSNLIQKNNLLIKGLIDKRIKYTVNRGIHGACAARNLGVSKSTGEIIAFLDDDDTWDRNKIEVMLPFLEDKVGLVYCNSNYIRNDKIIQKNVEIKKPNVDKMHAIFLTNFIGGCSIPILKKTIFYEAGEFDVCLPASQDIDLWIRVLEITNIHHVKQPLVNYYISDDSITRNLTKQNEARIKLLNKYNVQYDLYQDAKQAKINRIVITMILQRNYKGAIKFYNHNTESRGIEKILKGLKLILMGTIKNFVNILRGYN